MKWYKIFISTLFPATCASCGDVIEDGEFLCDYCFEMLPKCIFDKICLKCGLTKLKCDCKRRVFHFNGSVAPFYNEGVAQEAMYAFKFRKKEYAAEFFAEQMALTVKQCYNDVSFDLITCVPLHKLRQMRRGYNQSYLLAKRISDILGIQLSQDLLGARFKRKTQHKTVLKKRFKNVKGKYFCKREVTNKTILLVDDIKTTGATLDECSKELMSFGANKVYCITGLITDKKKG